MKTSIMAKIMRSYIDKLVELFLDRNMEYAGEEYWSANFERNAELNKVFGIKEIIEKSYGHSISHIIEKLDRLVNGILHALEGKKADHIGDSIDDAIVYLFITKNLLIEAGLIKEKGGEV